MLPQSKRNADFVIATSEMSIRRQSAFAKLGGLRTLLCQKANPACNGARLSPLPPKDPGL